MKTSLSKVLLIMAVGIICLMIVAGATAYAGGKPNPPTGDEGLMGPAVIGELTFYPDQTCSDGTYLVFDFVGQCQGEAVSVLRYCYKDNDYESVTEEGLQDHRFTYLVPVIGCPPNKFAQGLIVHSVLKYQEIKDEEGNSIMKKATVVMLFVVAK